MWKNQEIGGRLHGLDFPVLIKFKFNQDWKFFGSLFNSLSFLPPKGSKNHYYFHRPWEENESSYGCIWTVASGLFLALLPGVYSGKMNSLSQPRMDVNSSTKWMHPEPPRAQKLGEKQGAIPTLFRNYSLSLWIPVSKAIFVNRQFDHALNCLNPTIWLQLKSGKVRKKEKFQMHPYIHCFQ